jgi:hypothetical protein
VSLPRYSKKFSAQARKSTYVEKNLSRFRVGKFTCWKPETKKSYSFFGKAHEENKRTMMYFKDNSGSCSHSLSTRQR